MVLSSESSTTLGSVKMLAMGLGITQLFFTFFFITSSSTVFLHNSEGKMIFDAFLMIAFSRLKNILLVFTGLCSVSFVKTPEYHNTTGIFSFLAAMDISQGR